MEKLNKNKILGDYSMLAPEDTIKMLIDKINEVIEELNQIDDGDLSRAFSLADLFSIEGETDPEGHKCIYEDSNPNSRANKKINIY